MKAASEIEAGHLSGIADEQPPVGDGWMVPGFSMNGLEARQFVMGVGCGIHQSQLARAGEHDQMPAGQWGHAELGSHLCILQFKPTQVRAGLAQQPGQLTFPGRAVAQADAPSGGPTPPHRWFCVHCPCGEVMPSAGPFDAKGSGDGATPKGIHHFTASKM